MASIKDALEETFIEPSSGVKYLVLGALIYYCYLTFQHGAAFTPFNSALIATTYVILSGFILCVSYNVRNGKEKVLPSFLNPFEILIAGAKAIIALGPIIIINFMLANILTKIFVPFFISLGLEATSTTHVITFVIYAIFSSFVITGYMLYVNSFKISDAYNLKIISKYCIDILLAVLFLMPQLLIVNFIIIGSVTYLFWVLVGLPNVICTFFWCCAIVWNLTVLGNYLAQVDYEIIDAHENEFDSDKMDKHKF